MAWPTALSTILLEDERAEPLELEGPERLEYTERDRDRETEGASLPRLLRTLQGVGVKRRIRTAPRRGRSAADLPTLQASLARIVSSFAAFLRHGAAAPKILSGRSPIEGGGWPSARRAVTLRAATCCGLLGVSLRTADRPFSILLLGAQMSERRFRALAGAGDGGLLVAITAGRLSRAPPRGRALPSHPRSKERAMRTSRSSTPERSKTGSSCHLSRFIGSCDFGIASLGDEQAPEPDQAPGDTAGGEVRQSSRWA